MKLAPVGGRWLRVVLAGAAVIVVLLGGYLIFVRPLLSVSTPTGASATDQAGVPHRPAPGTPGAQSGPGPNPPVSTSAVKMPTGDLPGWHQVLADDFNGNVLGRNWFAYEGQPDGDPGGYFATSHVSVGGGLLTISGYQDPARRNIYATGGVSNVDAFAQSNGRYEVRFRMDQGKGIAYVLLLWPASNTYPPEIDFAEDNGRDRSRMYASLHPPGGGKAQSRTVDGDFSQWHTAGLEWTPNTLVFTLDGKEWGRITGNGVPTQKMTLAMQTQAWYCGHGWEACPDASTPARVDLVIDWAVAYEWTG